MRRWRRSFQKKAMPSLFKAFAAFVFARLSQSSEVSAPEVVHGDARAVGGISADPDGAARVRKIVQVVLLHLGAIHEDVDGAVGVRPTAKAVSTPFASPPNGEPASRPA
jgi:hypothetical protein